MPTPARVMTSSVLRGRISLTDRTIVVLPTPKPPTITIFSPLLAVLRSGVLVTRSELFKSKEHLLQDGGVGEFGLGGGGGRGGGRGPGRVGPGAQGGAPHPDRPAPRAP